MFDWKINIVQLFILYSVIICEKYKLLSFIKQHHGASLEITAYSYGLSYEHTPHLSTTFIECKLANNCVLHRILAQLVILTTCPYDTLCTLRFWLTATKQLKQLLHWCLLLYYILFYKIWLIIFVENIKDRPWSYPGLV